PNGFEGHRPRRAHFTKSPASVSLRRLAAELARQPASKSKLGRKSSPGVAGGSGIAGAPGTGFGRCPPLGAAGAFRKTTTPAGAGVAVAVGGDGGIRTLDAGFARMLP